MSEAREDWFEGQLDFDPERVVFTDETAAAANRARRHGRSPRGERCPIAVDLMDGATDGARFRTYVADVLVPALKPGVTVVMDNLSALKVKGVRQLIAAAGASPLHLPAYSPDFSPIENVFAKLKALLRTAAARKARDAICRGVTGRWGDMDGVCIDPVTAQVMIVFVGLAIVHSLQVFRVWRMATSCNNSVSV